MDNTNKPEEKEVPGKKEMRQQLTDKISAAIPELKMTLGEKKFHHRVKKAVKMITDGLHKKEAAKAVNKIKTAKKATAAKKVATKKVKAAKKSTL